MTCLSLVEVQVNLERSQSVVSVFSAAEADKLRLRHLLCWGRETVSDTAYNRHLHNHDFRGQD